MQKIEFSHVEKFYTSNVLSDTPPVLQNVSFTVQSGEILVVIGPNGRGKTTLLQLAAGFMRPQRGTITLCGTDPVPSKISYLDQNYRASLFPWLSSAENIILSGCSRKEAEKILVNFSIKHLSKKYAFRLSGGQAQLVAISRSLAKKSPLLLDEPFSALDMRTAYNTASIIRNHVKRTNIPCITVSHSIDIGILIADTIFVFPDSFNASPIQIPVEIGDRSENALYSSYVQSIRTRILKTMFNACA